MRTSRSPLLISLLVFLVIMMTLAEEIGKWLGLLLSGYDPPRN